ncbi:MAG: phosphoesterase [Deltaproteobacteria bacterium]|nr:phosphoesterase [Deltaproteobacteria bacterium]
MRLSVFFHGACFDGTASAALFARFHRDTILPGADLNTVGMRHRDGDPFADVPIDGDDNACVDFRYCADPRMRWWFDHHRTAFQPPALRERFVAAASPTAFFDPDAPSCAGLVARTTAAQFGWTPPPNLVELVRWADIIDAARFASAAEATSLAQPAQRLALWLGSADDAAINAYIAALVDGARLGELDAAPGIHPAIEALVASRAANQAAIAAAARPGDEVVVFDLADELGAPAIGFVGYQLFPHCRYTVSITRSAHAVKVGAGWNPWGPPRRHDVGALCEQHGGGGHAAVGGVTLEPGELARGRAVVAALAAALAVDTPPPP